MCTAWTCITKEGNMWRAIYDQSDQSTHRIKEILETRRKGTGYSDAVQWWLILGVILGKYISRRAYFHKSANACIPSTFHNLHFDRSASPPNNALLESEQKPGTLVQTNHFCKYPRLLLSSFSNPLSGFKKKKKILDSANSEKTWQHDPSKIIENRKIDKKSPPQVLFPRPVASIRSKMNLKMTFCDVQDVEIGAEEASMLLHRLINVHGDLGEQITLCLHASWERLYISFLTRYLCRDLRSLFVVLGLSLYNHSQQLPKEVCKQMFGAERPRRVNMGKPSIYSVTAESLQ